MIILPSNHSGLALADWLETSLLIDGPTRISIAAITELLEEADAVDPDAIVENLGTTVRTRRRILGDRYPVAREGEGFASGGDWTNNPLYGFLLFTSLNQHYPELTFRGGTANRPAEIFEWITMDATKSYFGCNAFRLGAPRREPVPAAFPTALVWAISQVQEIAGPEDVELQNSGDDGVDIVGWLPFGDGRQGQAMILTQCAIGNDWREKRREIDVELWRRHIDWHNHPPLRGFAVPFHHDGGGTWRETSTSAGIIFDRLRITRLTTIEKLPSDKQRALSSWCKVRVGSIRKLEIRGA